jgi:hypothetical protein
MIAKPTDPLTPSGIVGSVELLEVEEDRRVRRR